MLVSLDVNQDVVDMIGTLFDNVSVLERSSSGASDTTEGYCPPCTRSGRRGRPSFEIPEEQLSLLLEQGFKVEVSSILGVGKRTIERRMTAFGLCVSGGYEKWIVKDYAYVVSTYV